MPTQFIVRNATRNVVLADHGELAETPWRRMKGLLGRSELEPGGALVIRPCQGVHTWLMRFPIDVLHVDKSGIIRRVLPELAPNRLGPVDWGSQFVVELPAGTVRRTGTVAGDRLELAESRVPA